MQRAVQLSGQQVLHAQIEAEAERRRRAAEHIVERLIDAGEALVVDTGEADHVRRQRTVRIKALLFALEVEARNAEGIHSVFLARRQVALQPHEAALARELGAQLGRAGADRKSTRLKYSQ